jgi:lysophospholipase L1-like esterase
MRIGLLILKASTVKLLAVCLGIGLLAVSVTTATERSQAEWDAIFAKGLAEVEDRPGLPRVLLIGDSISVYYTVPTRRLLEGIANIHHVPINGGNTRVGLANIDKWLGSGHWDLIYFNWGLHDIAIRPGGKLAVPIDEYEANLQTLIQRLRKTGAVLVWATTTPVPAYIKAGSPRENKDVITYNEAAASIMLKEGVAVDDLYGFILPRANELQEPEDVHFSDAGSEALASEVAATVRKALNR